MYTKGYKGEKHEKSKEHDGIRPGDKATKRSYKNASEYKNFEGQVVE